MINLTNWPLISSSLSLHIAFNTPLVAHNYLQFIYYITLPQIMLILSEVFLPYIYVCILNPILSQESNPLSTNFHNHINPT